MFQVVVPMKKMFDAIFDNDCVSSVGSTIGKWCVVYCVPRDVDVTFFSEMCFWNQQDICLLMLYLGFDFFSMLGEPISIPQHYF